MTGTLFTDLVPLTHPLPYKDLSLSREKMEILVSHELKQKLPLEEIQGNYEADRINSLVDLKEFGSETSE